MVKKLIQKLFSNRKNPAQPVEKEQPAPPAKKPEPARSHAQRPPRQQSQPKSTPKPKEKVPHAPPWNLESFAVLPEAGKTRFHDLDLPDALMHGIADLGFRYCSPIQAKSLPHSLKGSDVVGKAQTGTGKTAAFLISVINDLMRNPLQHERYSGEARALVLAPTRELALQIAEDAEALAKYCGLHVHTLVGGVDYQKQRDALNRRLVDILVATPGRLIDYLDNREIFLDELECLVIDEADRMLDMGFIPQVKRIVRMSPRKENRQTLLFSATFSQDVLNLASQWTCQPVFIEIEPENIAADTVEQKVYLVGADERLVVLNNLLQDPTVESMMVFANRRDTCRDLHEQLVALGISAGLLSGDIHQTKRIRTLEQFKNGQLKVLVATDVAGRGIHIEGVSHVVNYTLPDDPEDYVHRIGRTGRAGASGVSISFATEDDAFALPPIEKLLGRKLATETPPEALLVPLPAGIQLPGMQKRRHHGGGGTGFQRRGGGGRDPRHGARRPRRH